MYCVMKLLIRRFLCLIQVFITSYLDALDERFPPSFRDQEKELLILVVLILFHMEVDASIRHPFLLHIAHFYM